MPLRSNLLPALSQQHVPRDSGNLHHHIPAARRVQPPRLLITAGNSENPCPLPLLRCQTISALGARWGESALKVPTQHPQNARNLVHDWRAKSGNSENYCPRCHKNIRPLPPRVRWYRLECFPPAGLVFQPGNLNPALKPLKGKWRESSPPWDFNGCRRAHFIRSPARASHSLLVQEGPGLAAIRLSSGMNRRPLLRHALPE